MIGSSNCAYETPFISTTLVEVVVSVVENRYVVFSDAPTQTSPDCSVKNLGVLEFVVPKFISLILIDAVAAVFERGT